MPRYIDGFIIPVPKDRVEDYRAMAEKACAVWKEHGALEYSECIGDDLDAFEGGPMSFSKIANAAPDETIFFSWAVFESREARDKANEEIMTDPRLQDIMDPDDPVFDCKRMAFGGFSQFVHG